MKYLYLFSFSTLLSLSLLAQPDRWQQRVKYTMHIDMDVEKNLVNGKQKLDYSNNSPDTLSRVFFHLYWNAFQPNSMMDVKSRRQGSIILRQDGKGNNIADWDPRVEDRIAQLKPEEYGYSKVSYVKMNGRQQKIKEHETILEVILDKPILPRSKVSFEMEWTGQVPLQIRRSGRDNEATEVRYTMTQWYPKMAEYDLEGWHPSPYVNGEFYGVWGDYDVTIQIDRNYILGGSGNIVNANEVGYGYEEKGTKVNRPAGKKLSWHFLAPNVHDFAWAADPDFKHIIRQIPNGPTIHVLYNNRPTQIGFLNLSSFQQAAFGNDFNRYAAAWDKEWELIADAAVTIYPFIKKNFGEYPYKQYSFIHGGDGGMEYPNCTMLNKPSMGTAFHEWMHSWYQMLLATNESIHAWMDEGFTEWSTDLVEEYYRQQVSRKSIMNDPVALRASDSTAMVPPAYHQGIYAGYLALVKSGKEEPMTTHSDHFNTIYAYKNASYSKGGVFIEQLGYIIGAEARDRTMLSYYRQWRFKHPRPNDFVRIAEKESGMQLDWYKEYWVNTTKTIDYGIDSLWEVGGATNVRLKNSGMIPMPIDVKISFKDGSSEWHYIPMNLMYGAKPSEKGQENRKEYEAWKWTHPQYTISSTRKLTDIVSVEIDPSFRMADINRKDNRLELRW